MFSSNFHSLKIGKLNLFNRIAKHTREKMYRFSGSHQLNQWNKSVPVTKKIFVWKLLVYIWANSFCSRLLYLIFYMVERGAAEKLEKMRWIREIIYIVESCVRQLLKSGSNVSLSFVVPFSIKYLTVVISGIPYTVHPNYHSSSTTWI